MEYLPCMFMLWGAAMGLDAAALYPVLGISVNIVSCAPSATTILHDRPGVALATLRGVMQRPRENE